MGCPPKAGHRFRTLIASTRADSRPQHAPHRDRRYATSAADTRTDSGLQHTPHGDPRCTLSAADTRTGSRLQHTPHGDPRLFTRLAAAAAAALVGFAWAMSAAAKEEPLLEFGLGVGAVAFEDYRGSDTTHGYPLPIPYLVYNGTFLKADREGVRGTLFNQRWVELNLSGNATTPVRNDSARSGMPDLKSTLEVGPSLDFHLLASADSRIKFDVRLPLRAACAVAAPPHFIGGTFTPRLALDVADPWGFGGWHAGVLAGPLFADRRYDDYFYSVAPAYATPSRPAYQATGGYAGTQTITALSKRFPRFWVGAYARYDTLSGASFEHSPLVRQDRYWSAGFGFAWILYSSRQMVDVHD